MTLLDGNRPAVHKKAPARRSGWLDPTAAIRDGWLGSVRLLYELEDILIEHVEIIVFL